MAELKGTSIKDALHNWQKKNNVPLKEAEYVGLQFQWPPIERMDNNLSILLNCEHLSLSSNVIEKINGLTALKNLKILALGRNNIKTFAGIESLADNLEELWISYNDIERMKGVLNMRRLKVLHMSHNKVEDLNEVQNLGKMESLLDFVFVGNPLYESMEESTWRSKCIKLLPKLSLLDGIPAVTIND